ncbi:M1 family metallopeptidase [Psychrobium sp. MM17-31]|uniref:M1 family metallopeptidase n=1 Tax=Psychrobium sp. MM17-31 TaxID=2917758 RepID=UPI001EF66DF8|nr:M1 family metallopeptidase [Psychrobium sp. MM17-31]MCG7532785.1 M1 family metallopeptidase [Psychrobium sp. MM17-31]
MQRLPSVRFLQRLVLLLGVIFTSTAMASALRMPGPHTDRVHHTHIKATLDAEKHRVKADMTLRWKNTTGVELTEIPFHLYLNAFSRTDTIFMTESNGGRLRNDTREGDDQDKFGYVHVTAITDASGEDQAQNWLVDGDVATYKLPQPLLPNQEVTLNIAFTSQLPKVFARSGHNGDTFNFVAQWFPKPGVYYNGRWVNHNYHANTEFFADFGTYDVEITAPSDYVVGATGYLVKKETQEALTTHHYQAEDVHDFVWTADSKFAEATAEWNGITIRLLHQKPLSEKSIQNQFDAAKASFEWFDKHVGAYPYSTMTLVQPPENAGGAAGMEYPTLVTTITDLDYSEYMHAAAMVTIHEIGHNYWQGIFASNEFEESWMDEGINSYTEGRIMSETLGQANIVQFAQFSADMPTMHHVRTAQTPTLDPVKTHGWMYVDRGGYSTNSYSKPATILNTVERVWGVEKVDQLLKTYYKRWAFKHPSTQDFIAIADEIDPSMARYLNDAITTIKNIDFEVKSATSGKKQVAGGFSFSDDNEEPSFNKPEKGEGYVHRVTLVRNGELHPPQVDVLLTFADGSTETRQWQPDNTIPWTKWQWESDVKLVEVMIDPKFKVLLDKDFSNNTKRLGKKSNESWRWAISLLQNIQHAFSIALPL